MKTASGINSSSSDDEENHQDGYHFEFLNNNNGDESYECMICLKIIKNFVVELPCGHAGCCYCIQHL